MPERLSSLSNGTAHHHGGGYSGALIGVSITTAAVLALAIYGFDVPDWIKFHNRCDPRLGVGTCNAAWSLRRTDPGAFVVFQQKLETAPALHQTDDSEHGQKPAP